MMKRTITYVIEQDEDGIYVADVPELPGCHTQAKSLEELEIRVKEAVELYFDELKDESPKIKFIGIKQTEVSIS